MKTMKTLSCYIKPSFLFFVTISKILKTAAQRSWKLQHKTLFFSQFFSEKIQIVLRKFHIHLQCSNKFNVKLPFFEFRLLSTTSILQMKRLKTIWKLLVYYGKNIGTLLPLITPRTSISRKYYMMIVNIITTPKLLVSPGWR